MFPLCRYGVFYWQYGDSRTIMGMAFSRQICCSDRFVQELREAVRANEYSGTQRDLKQAIKQDHGI